MWKNKCQKLNWGRRESLARERGACQFSQGDLRGNQTRFAGNAKQLNLLKVAGKSSLAIKQDSYLHVRPHFLSNVLAVMGSPRVSIYRQ